MFSYDFPKEKKIIMLLTINKYEVKVEMMHR